MFYQPVNGQSWSRKVANLEKLDIFQRKCLRESVPVFYPSQIGASNAELKSEK